MPKTKRRLRSRRDRPCGLGGIATIDNAKFVFVVTEAEFDVGGVFPAGHLEVGFNSEKFGIPVPGGDQFRMQEPPADLLPFIVRFWIIRWDSELGHYDSSEVMHRPYVDVFLSTQKSGIQDLSRQAHLLGGRQWSDHRYALPSRGIPCVWPGQMTDQQDQVVPITHFFPWADCLGVARIPALDDDAAIMALVKQSGQGFLGRTRPSG